MGSERLKLSKSWLDSMEAVAKDDDESQEVTHVVPAAMLDLIAEVRERRAADLSDEEREALGFLAVMLRKDPEVTALVGQHPRVLAGLAALDKLLGGKP